jgi:hypothetical protein
MAVSVFAPFANPAQFSPWGSSPQGVQGLGVNPYAFPYTQNQPLMSAPLSSTIASPAFGQQPLQQGLPLLQIVPQQLQHLQQLVSVQLQELQQLQQLIQLVPAQLQQLQQLIQFVPQQIQQQLQQQSPFLQPVGQGAALNTPAAIPPWGIGPHAFGAQPNQVM